LHGYEAYFKTKKGKEVGIISNEGSTTCKVFKQLADTLLQGAQDYFTQGSDYTLSAAVCASLGWPNSVTLTRIRIRGENHQKPTIDNIKSILEYIREDEAPWIYLETSSAVQDNSSHDNQVDYAQHSILQLETWKDTLTKQEAEYATSLFALLRRNHRRSRDFVEDLIKLFAPLRQRNIIDSERSRSLLDTFEGQVEVAPHPSHLEKIESLALALDGPSAEDARAILYLVRRGFGTCRDYMDELKVVFGPLQQRNAEEWKRAVEIKKVFEAIDKETEVMEVV